MKGFVSNEAEVKAPATDVWAVYSSFRLAQICVEDMPDIVAAYEFIEGDGGEGSILKVTPGSGIPGAGYFVEKFVIVDHEARVKVAEQIEGGYLSLGFKSYAVRFQVIGKPDDGSGSPSSLVRTTIEYETADDSNSDPASFVSTDFFAALAQAVGRRLVTH